MPAAAATFGCVIFFSPSDRMISIAASRMQPATGRSLRRRGVLVSLLALAFTRRVSPSPVPEFSYGEPRRQSTPGPERTWAGTPKPASASSAPRRSFADRVEICRFSRWNIVSMASSSTTLGAGPPAIGGMERFDVAGVVEQQQRCALAAAHCASVCKERGTPGVVGKEVHDQDGHCRRMWCPWSGTPACPWHGTSTRSM